MHHLVCCFFHIGRAAEGAFITAAIKSHFSLQLKAGYKVFFVFEDELVFYYFYPFSYLKFPFLFDNSFCILGMRMNFHAYISFLSYILRNITKLEPFLELFVHLPALFQSCSSPPVSTDCILEKDLYTSLVYVIYSIYIILRVYVFIYNI